MKKVMICALTAFALVACSQNGNPTEEAVVAIQKATVQVKNAKTADDLTAATDSLASEMKQLKEKYPDYKPTDEDTKKVKDATIALEKAMMGKASLMVSDFAAPAEPAE